MVSLTAIYVYRLKLYGLKSEPILANEPLRDWILPDISPADLDCGLIRDLIISWMRKNCQKAAAAWLWAAERGTRWKKNLTQTAWIFACFFWPPSDTAIFPSGSRSAMVRLPAVFTWSFISLRFIWVFIFWFLQSRQDMVFLPLFSSSALRLDVCSSLTTITLWQPPSSLFRLEFCSVLWSDTEEKRSGEFPDGWTLILRWFELNQSLRFRSDELFCAHLIFFDFLFAVCSKASVLRQVFPLVFCCPLSKPAVRKSAVPVCRRKTQKAGPGTMPGPADLFLLRTLNERISYNVRLRQ